jgi:AraC-like DNA-binding protein
MSRHHGDWNWKNVSSPFTRIYCVTEGEALLHLPGRTVTLRPGHLYMIPAYTPHSYECTGLFTHYYLHVYEGVKKQIDVMELYDFPVEVVADEGDEHVFQRMCQRQPDACLPASNPQSYDNATTFAGYVQRYRDMALWEKMELRGAMLTLLSRFMREATPKVWTQDERMKKVLSYVNRQIDRDISVDELASVACVSKPYLIRLFRREFGTSPLQHVNRKKVERAQLLLYTTNMPIKEVAYTLGFGDHSYFIRLFRKQAGITPQEYRKRMR